MNFTVKHPKVHVTNEDSENHRGYQLAQAQNPAAMKLRHLLLGRKAMTNFDSILKEQRHHFANKGPYNQSFF